MKNDKKQILIIEQEANLVNGLKAILEKEGYATNSLYSYLGIQSLFEEGKFDWAIINITKPAELGINIIRRTKERYPTLPVIAVSVYSDIFNKQDLAVAGADDFIKKPFDVDYLKRRIRELISSQN
jgi:DNA-binding response OmpR family regulator